MNIDFTMEQTAVETQKQYFYSLDGIRGIAAFLIVLRHSSTFLGALPFQESYLAVDIFFALSGIVIANAYEARLLSTLPVKQFIWLRFIRLYPLYILGSMFTVIAIFLGVSEAGNAKYLTMIILLSVFMLPNMSSSSSSTLYPLNGPAWSLFFELIANVVYAIFVRFLTMRRLIFIMFTSAICLAVCLCISKQHNMNLGFGVKTMPAGLFRVGYSFFAGVILYRLFSSKLQSTPIIERHASFALYSVLTLVAALLMFSPGSAIRPYFDFFAVVAIFPPILYFALQIQPTGWSKQVCKFMGTISYALYVLHAPINVLAQRILENNLGIIAVQDKPELIFRS